MTSVSTDRRQGVNSSAAVKVPVKAATTANITLSGEQTIDGVACVTDDRVLVKNQTATADNGIYDVDTGSWTRAVDFDGTYDAKKGTLIYVNPGGSANGDAWYRVSTDDPITIGTSSLSFARQNINFVAKASAIASAGQTLFNLGASYQTGSNGLEVYVNGLRQRITDDYTETSSTSITFTYALQANDELDVYVATAAGQLAAAAAAQSAVTDAGDFYVGTTVEAVLQEIPGAIAIDNGDADAIFTNGSSARVQRWNTALSANRALTLSTSNAKEGAWALAVRGSGATGNFTLSVGSLATLRAPGEWALCRYDSGTAAWVITQYGFLPSSGVRTMGADVGDADKTLTVGSDGESQRWATPLTAERTATLATAGAWAGAKFEIVRTETATGAFSLNVAVGLTRLLRLAPGQFANCEYTGTTWIVTEFGYLRPGLTIIELRDDFLGDEIDGSKWFSLIGTDAACVQANVLADQQGGVVRLTTGANAAASMAVDGCQVNSSLNWQANRGGLMFEARVAIDVITSVAVFIGFTDQTSALEMPFTLGAADALTSNATDSVGVLFDTAADTDNWWLVGVKADIDATAQNSAVAPTAGTFETWRIEIDATGQATFYRNGAVIGAVMGSAVTASVKITPVVAAFSRSAASRNIDLNHIIVQAQQ